MDFQFNLNRDTIGQAYPFPPVCVEPETTVREVFRVVKERKTGSVLVCRDERLVGIFTERDALKLMADGADLDVPVETVMATPPVTVREDDSVGTAIARMSRGGYRRLPIVDEGGACLGQVKVSGILRYLVEYFPETIYNLPPKPHHKTVQREGA